jgi:hypothetical protein
MSKDSILNQINFNHVPKPFCELQLNPTSNVPIYATKTEWYFPFRLSYHNARTLNATSPTNYTLSPLHVLIVAVAYQVK